MCADTKPNIEAIMRARKGMPQTSGASSAGAPSSNTAPKASARTGDQGVGSSSTAVRFNGIRPRSQKGPGLLADKGTP